MTKHIWFCTWWVTLLLAVLVAFNKASRKDLWSHYSEVALAARLAHVCSAEVAGFKGSNGTSLLLVCFVWCWCVLGVLFLPSHDLPSPTGKRGWVKQGGRGGVCGNGGGVTAHSLPSFQNPGNRLLAAVCKMFLFHVSGFFRSCQRVGCDLKVFLKNT